MQSRRIAQVALLTFLFAAGVRADGARFWTVESGKDLNEGKPEKITLTADEALILAPRIKRLVDTGQPFIWCLGLDRRTGCLYAATGHEGRVLRIGADGDTATVFDAGQAEVSALALNEKGDLFVGTSPEGAVYRLAGGQGPARLFYDPEEKYIWSLVFDSGGKLHVAVGPKGKVYRLDSGGKARLILDSDETHIISLAFDRQGNLLAGSSGEALVYEISPRGKVSILFDSPLKDIRSIVVDSRNGIWVAGFDIKGPSRVQPPVMPKKETESKPESGQSQGSSPGKIVIQMPLPAPPRPAAASEIYYFDRDRYAWRLWSGKGEAIMALGLDSQDRAIFVTSEEKDSKLLVLYSLGEITLLSSFEESQVTGFLRDDKQGKLYLCSSNLGRIYEITDGFSASGTYTSRVHDAGFTAQWGRINWEGDLSAGTDIHFQTRSGNTSKPDTTWSRWSPIFRGTEGETEKVSSPPRKYFQWRSVLKSSSPKTTPRLEKVKLSYLLRNQPPRVSPVRVLPPGLYIKAPPTPPDNPAGQEEVPEEFIGMVTGKKPSAPGNPFQGKKEYSQGVRMAGWNASDGNDTELRFNVYYRGVGEKLWRPLELGTKNNSVSWDTRTWADGRYLLRVTVHDSLGNPGDRALAASRTSRPFYIDNTPPVVENLLLEAPATGAVIELSFSASDATSIIKKAEVALDAGKWKAVLSMDKIADHKRESYRTSFQKVARGEHTVSVRVYDEFYNKVVITRTVVVK